MSARLNTAALREQQPLLPERGTPEERNRGMLPDLVPIDREELEHA
jgi:hypothetical protein